MSDAAQTESRPMELSRDAAAVPPGKTKTATFGMGCFWGPDARFGAMDGVVRTRVGYAGGTKRNPQYHSLGDQTEVVQIEYDPTTLSYTDLLAVFWANHSPTRTVANQQYRTVALVATAEQRGAAERTRNTVTERVGREVTTSIEQLNQFYLAEQYHQKYELRSAPIVGDELEETYDEALVNSTVAARLNGFVAGHGDAEQHRQFLAEVDLSPAALSELQRRL